MTKEDMDDLKEAFYFLGELIDHCQDAGYDGNPDEDDPDKFTDSRLDEAIGYAGGVHERLESLQERRNARKKAVVPV